MDARAELQAMLRPAGGGVYVVSTGRAEQLDVQRKLYGASSEAEIATRFAASLDRIASANAIVLGVPSDVGAGYRRGANLAPQAIRAAMLERDRDLRGWMERRGIVDIGDVIVVPQLLHDEMLSAKQIAASRAALYGSASVELPVSPLSIEERVLRRVMEMKPGIVPIVLGGDHSVAWPVAAALAGARSDRWGIVQPDAHTDLLSDRLGVKYCFATWSYHANELLGRDGRMVQVGVRASRHDRGHWEKETGVRQFWAEEIANDPHGAIEGIVAHLRGKGVQSVYFSNDIDGTDAKWASATGTPEQNGLEPEWVVELVGRLGKEFGLCAADCVEVAPPLGPTVADTEATVGLAARYVRACLETL
jgi:guanidinobutyrase